MDWITREIVIGSYHEAQDTDLLRRESIRSVLGLIGTLQGRRPGDLGVERIEVLPLLDGPGNDLSRFCRAVATTTQSAGEPSGKSIFHTGRSGSRVAFAGRPSDFVGSAGSTVTVAFPGAASFQSAPGPRSRTRAVVSM